MGQNVMVAGDVVIGDGCRIQNNVSVYTGVELEDDVFLGPSMVFTNVRHPRAFINKKNQFGKTLVRRGATIGANATIICGITIGEYSFIGAGALVKDNVPAYAFFAGVPASQKGWVCRCGEKIEATDRVGQELKILCSVCGLGYTFSDGKIRPLPD